MTAPSPKILSISGLTKGFPGVQALNDVGFSLQRGEVHALLGENGAGKSTLLKILSGVYRADAGEILIDGKPVVLGSPKAANLAGIAMIHQELQQVPELDVAQNMFLGAPLTRLGLFTNKIAMRERARAVLAEIDPTIEVTAKIRDLRVAQRQIVEIAKALLSDAKVIAMDEPTSSLTPREFDRLIGIIERLSARGVAVIYVSHKLEEVYRIASTGTILRDGRKVADVDLKATSEEQLVAMMVGRALDSHPHQSHTQPEIALDIRRLGRGNIVRNVSFEVRKGEVLGIAGLVGSGRTELVRLIAGVDRPTAGEIRVAGVKEHFNSPRDAIAKGIALLPEERKKDAIIPLRSIISNVFLPKLGALTRFACARMTLTDRFGSEAILDRVDLSEKSIMNFAISGKPDQTNAA
eukprot:gene18138-18384_t